MVETKKLKLETEMEVDVPMDIVVDKQRLKAVEDGIVRVISRGLYEEGVSFKIVKVNFILSWRVIIIHKDYNIIEHSE